MSAEVFNVSEEEQKALAEVLNEMEAGPSTSGTPPLLPCVGGPDIPTLHEQLAVLVTTGKAKEAIGVQLSHEQVKQLSDRPAVPGLRWLQTTDGLIDSLIFLHTKAVGMAVDIEDMKAYQ